MSGCHEESLPLTAGPNTRSGVKSAVAAAVMLLMPASTAGAAEWQTVEDKGIFLHSLRDGSAKLEMVCDPDELWSPPEFHVLVTDGGHFLEGDVVEFRAGDEALKYPLSGGSIVGVNADEWNALVAVLSRPGSVSFSAAGIEIKLKVEGALRADCEQ